MFTLHVSYRTGLSLPSSSGPVAVHGSNSTGRVFCMGSFGMPQRRLQASQANILEFVRGRNTACSECRSSSSPEIGGLL
ncbi:hypothetical protein TNCV_4378121 [Trichonephila clavipes]|nr:hypothetical protein TNCV_4378121 [Trichonephila clavipes]